MKKVDIFGGALLCDPGIYQETDCGEIFEKAKRVCMQQPWTCKKHIARDIRNGLLHILKIHGVSEEGS